MFVFFQCGVEHLPQHGQGERALVFERELVERDEDRGKRAHVARCMADQVLQCGCRDIHATGFGLGGECVDFFGIRKRMQAKNQAGAETGTQVFSPLQLLGRLAAGNEDFSAGTAFLATKTVKLVEEFLLSVRIKVFEVVDAPKRLWCCGFFVKPVGVLPGVEVVSAVVLGGLQQVRFACTTVAPEKKASACLRCLSPCGECGQGLGILAGHEIFEGGR